MLSDPESMKNKTYKSLPAREGDTLLLCRLSCAVTRHFFHPEQERMRILGVTVLLPPQHLSMYGSVGCFVYKAGENPFSIKWM